MEIFFSKTIKIRNISQSCILKQYYRRLHCINQIKKDSPHEAYKPSSEGPENIITYLFRYYFAKSK